MAEMVVKGLAVQDALGRLALTNSGRALLRTTLPDARQSVWSLPTNRGGTGALLVPQWPLASPLV